MTSSPATAPKTTSQPAPTEWRAWLAALFPAYVGAPFSARHEAFWEWVWSLQPDAPAAPFIAVWPRGGGKSTSAELACVALGARGVRKYVLYVCETQDQADRHVQNIAGMLESTAFGEQYPTMAERLVGKYGSSKGWRGNRLRTASGFTIDALGLDTASRGAKADNVRPDLIVLDDVDGRHDTPHTTQKKIETITQSILPTGAPALAVLGMQNLIHAHSVFARLVDGRADFLAGRSISGPYQAVEGLTWQMVNDKPTITAGTATWEGQNLATCEHQMRLWGPAAFLSESQQEVGREGRFFRQWDADRHTCAPFAIPADWPMWGGFDYGFTHPTAFYLFAQGPDSIYVFAEHVQARWLPLQHALAIAGLYARLGINRHRVRFIVAGHDVFATKGDKDGLTIAQQYANLRDPATNDDISLILTHAQIDRVSGASELQRRLGNPEANLAPTLRIFTTCPRLIACLPRMIADPARPEDVLKVNADADGNGGDDEYDSARYGVMAAARFVSGPLAY